MYTIHLKDGISFDCEAHESLVDGAKRNGIFTQVYTTCKLKVTKGETKPLSAELSLSEQDREERYILSCVRTPSSELWIDAEDLSGYGTSKYNTIPASLFKLALIAAWRICA